jgi:signal transduction histidine kinase
MLESNLFETVNHLRQVDQLTGRFLVSMAAELRTLDSMFDQMRLETGEFEVDIQEVDFEQLVERVMIVVSNYMEIINEEVEQSQKNIATPIIQYRLPKQFPMIKMDCLRIERILTEILLVAVQISRSRKGKIRFLAEFDEGWLQIKISDNGVGLPEHLINHLPDLPLTSEVVVERHGGKLAVNNRAGGGWRLTLQFPINMNG